MPRPLRKIWQVTAYWIDGRTTRRTYNTQRAAISRAQRWMEPWEGQPGYNDPRPGAARCEVTCASVGEFTLEFESGSGPIPDRTDAGAVDAWLEAASTAPPGFRRVNHGD